MCVRGESDDGLFTPLPTRLCSHHLTPDLPQTSTAPLEDAELRYALTLSKDMLQKVRGYRTWSPDRSTNYDLSFCPLVRNLSFNLTLIDQSKKQTSLIRLLKDEKV